MPFVARRLLRCGLLIIAALLLNRYLWIAGRGFLCLGVLSPEPIVLNLRIRNAVFVFTGASYIFFLVALGYQEIVDKSGCPPEAWTKTLSRLLPPGGTPSEAELEAEVDRTLDLLMAVTDEQEDDDDDGGLDN